MTRNRANLFVETLESRSLLSATMTNMPEIPSDHSAPRPIAVAYHDRNDGFTTDSLTGKARSFERGFSPDQGGTIYEPVNDAPAA